MGLLGNIFLALAHFFLAALDVALVFAAAELLSRRKPWPLVVAMSKAGQPFVDALLQKMRLSQPVPSRPALSRTTQLSLLVLILFLVRTVVSLVGFAAIAGGR